MEISEHKIKMKEIEDSNRRFSMSLISEDQKANFFLEMSEEDATCYAR